MTTHVSGQHGVTSAVAPTLHVGTYRRALLRIIIGSPYFTDAEQVLANHNAHECADAARLARWTRNARRVAAERQAAAEQQPAQPTPPAAPAAMPAGYVAPATLADLANPAYVAQHGQRPYSHGLTVADAAAGLASLRRATTPVPAEPTPVEPTPAPAAEPWATPAQCDEVFALACKLSPRQKATALNLLPTLTSSAAAAFIRGLVLRTSPRVRVGAGALTVPVTHYEAARVDYVRDAITGRALPRCQSGGGVLVQQVWAN